MVEENPYLPPHAEPLAESGTLDVRRLRVLGWLTLAALLVLPLANMVVAVLADGAESHALKAFAIALSVLSPVAEVIVFLGFGKLLTSRYGLGSVNGPIYLLVATTLLSALVSALTFDWLVIAAGVLTALSGAAMIWLGIRMLKANYNYSLLRATGVLNIIAGALTCSVLFVFVAALPFVAVAIMMSVLFFRAARETSALGSASATRGSAPAAG